MSSERMNERFDLGEGIARQELNVIFVIDNSGSMQGEKIGAVNNAIRDIMSIMPDIQDDTGDATIKISAMTFSDDAKWIYKIEILQIKTRRRIWNSKRLCKGH